MPAPQINQADLIATILADSGPEAQEMRAVLTELVEQQLKRVPLTELPAYQTVRAQDAAYRSRLVRAITTAYTRSYGERGGGDIRWALGDVLADLLQTTLSLTQEDCIQLFVNARFNFIKPGKREVEFHSFPANAVLSQLIKIAQQQTLNPTTRAFLEAMSDRTSDSEDSLLLVHFKVQEALGQSSAAGALPVVAFDQGDPLGQRLRQFGEALAPTGPAARPWQQLLRLWQKTSGGQPTAKFRQELDAATAAVGPEAVREQGRAWLELLVDIPVPGPEREYQRSDGTTFFYSSCDYLTSTNSTVAKGLVWTMQPLADAAMLPLFTALVTKCFRKRQYQGPLNVALGNAGLLALAQNGLPGMAALSRIRGKVRQSNTQALIAKYIGQESAKLGVSPAEVEDLSVPDFGLENGRLTEELGEYTATLALTGGKVELSWQKGDQPLKSAPAALKATHAEELKELKDAQTTAQQTYTAQRERLDRGFADERRIAWPWFAQYYLHHGLLGELARPLIWRLHQPDGSVQDAIYQADTWQDAQGQPVPAPTADTTVQLWHPVLVPAGQVVAWRLLLDKWQLRQPLKQAYREVYLLTPPEEVTNTYSNRMAAHILKQPQLNSLAKLRGWRYKPMGYHDRGNQIEAASLALPAHGLTAEFWVREVDANDAFNHVGIWLYVSTDQVRFMRGRELVPLPEIPPLVFSEVLRDVDLFVGVASVGNDPLWRDNGGLGQYRAYWERYSFGNLSEVAKNRHLALERLVPRLKIAKVSELRGNFLVVRGTRHVYKIHVGSGNILMEPNDQYLCIVPDQAAKTLSTGDVFLPFEGDAVLSIILSKALLLMEDDKITDQTILCQL
ncbi:DUF4132 domain-containing protein [Hymenobacter sp. H14-R3]|uniref:DUF4132 domain-containing protein n=1 Tax=Hymenobacter sp. H14-R3 TaxID=3046308 RepID=UPI0024B8B2B0|nr:DUF4132 domain-containing protein [Hymenobacter sp. H14-R3]MDJ0364734.1 DUF4132 domain-containing protein [Hymenobacter sp. H14-R3]